MTDADDPPDEGDGKLDRLLRERREFLQGLAATTGGALAGCAGDSGDGPETGADTGKTATPTEEPTPTPVEPPAPDTEAYEESPALPPEEAPASFKLAPGYELELVASEPLIEHPVDVEWDARGRLWVVEMRDYMVSVEGDAPMNEPPNGRISVLEDPDGDGRMEQRTVFWDGLTLPRSLAFVEGGVLVAAPPNLVYCEYDEDTLEIENREVVLEGYGANLSDPEKTENGLVFGLDNWRYSANGEIRVRFRDGELEVEDTQFRGQWGIARDDYGRLFYTNNTHWLFGDLIPGEYLVGEDLPGIGIGESMVDNQAIFTIRENHGTNRAYRDGYHRSDGRMRTNDAVCGPGIYRGGLLDADGSAFVPDPAGNVVARFDLDGTASGLSLHSEHRLYEDDQWGRREFLASTDEVFRPVQAKTGPDGGLYVVDMYKGIIQHETYLTDYLKRYILDNDLHRVPPAGRIYRIVPSDGDVDPADGPDVSEASPSELAESLRHPNGWARDAAQRRLVQERLTDGAAALREIARGTGEATADESDGTDSSDEALARIHALWALRGMGQLDAETVFAALDAEDPHLVQAAMRTGETLLGTDDAEAYVSRLIEWTENGGQRLVVQAAFSLGEVTDPELQPAAREAIESLLAEYDGQAHVLQAGRAAPFVDR